MSHLVGRPQNEQQHSFKPKLWWRKQQFSPGHVFSVSPRFSVSKTVRTPVYRWDHGVCVESARSTGVWWTKRVHLMWQGSETVWVTEGCRHVLANSSGVMQGCVNRDVQYNRPKEDSTGCLVLKSIIKQTWKQYIRHSVGVGFKPQSLSGTKRNVFAAQSVKNCLSAQKEIPTHCFLFPLISESCYRMLRYIQLFLVWSVLDLNLVNFRLHFLQAKYVCRVLSLSNI